MENEYKPRYLVMVTAGNNNKYYRQIPNGDGTWVAEYGRVGATPQRRTYSMSNYDKKYKEKINKGYVDQTELVEDLIVEKKGNQKKEYKDIENSAIAEIVEKLQRMAKQAIQSNYNISSDKVTHAMVDEAQVIINGLLAIDIVEIFNNELLKLFTVIPRKMSDVSYYLASSKEEFPKIIQREQDLLDVMKGQVVEKQTIEEDSDTTTEHDCTILEALGLEFEECDKEDIARIKAALGDCSHKFSRAWRVKNNKTQKLFDDFVRDNKINDIRLLFHGSRNENWWSIINTGLVLRPTNAVITGKMFGYGIYYAPKARKSLGYTSLSGSYWANGSSNIGYMALMDVAYGKPYNVHSFDSKYYNFDYEKLQRNCPGANCLHAHAGQMLRNDEIVIYKKEQSTIRYFVEIKN